MKFRHLFKDPLIHFLLIGLILFFVSEKFLDSGDGFSDSSKIVVSKQRQQHLALIFESQYQRKPGERELKALVDQYVVEEVYYREALKLGLDDEDPVIKRRLQQKLELLHEDALSYAVPDDEVLQAWFEINKKQFALKPRYTFTQILLNDLSAQQVPAIIEQLNNQEIEPSTINTSAMLETNSTALSVRDISNRFGDDFASAISMLVPDAGWQGPIESVFGIHLVLPVAVIPGRAPNLSEVKEQVVTAYQLEQQRQNKVINKQELLSAYDIQID